MALPGTKGIRIGALLLSLLGFSLFSQPLQAAPPPSDAACRGCHDETERQLTFPSGETLALQVALEQLDRSAHSALASEPVACSGCHVNATRYRYPHLDQPAPSHQEFVAAIGQTCQGCHYPHNPFHQEPTVTQGLSATHGLTATLQPTVVVTTTLASTATASMAASAARAQPTCLDCHGSHNIDRMANITRTMPANCLTCHSDQTPAWALQYIAPRPGLGRGAAGYIGSARCAGCHEEQYFSWQKTLHAQMVQAVPSDVNSPTNPIRGDFTQPDPDLTFTPQDVLYTIGSVWKQVYLSQTVEGKLFILPAEWQVDTSEWVAYQPDTGSGNEWLANCGSCHVTGLNTEQGSFTELSIGCESCHGPGASHAKDPQQVKLFAAVDDQVCGSCHSRGTSPAGQPFPASYRPGDTLTDHFTLATGDDVRWPDGSAKLHNQQYTDWQLGNRMAQTGEVHCTSCHTVHDPGVAPRQLRAPLHELCLQCHTEQKALVNHVPFHEQAIVNQRHEFTCADCHMPKLASSATGLDIRSHSFLQPDPQGSLDHGGLSAMPNACNRCHNKPGEDATWAAQTIAYVKERSVAKPVAFFGPGPTPTSPPPPTPISVAGQPGIKQEPGLSQWLRPALLTAFWLLVAVVLLGILNLIRLRRVKNA